MLAYSFSYHENAGIFILLSRECDQSAITSLHRSCQPSVYHTNMGESHLVPFPMPQQINLPACSPHCHLMPSVMQGNCEYATNFEVMGLTRLGIILEFTATEEDALTNRLFELFDHL